MPFSTTVYNKAMVACGRCCCICHRFVGKHIELHHIKQEADGGPNTFDNAIPLCLDCHADMGKTDPHHPKGRNYTSEELRGHRDHWYEIVKAGGVAFKNIDVTVGLSRGDSKNETKTSADRTDTNDAEEMKEYCKRYRMLRFLASCVLDYYANVYTDIVDAVDDRHEKASDALRKMGVMIKAFAIEEQKNVKNIPDANELKEVAGLYIGLSNALYSNSAERTSRLLDSNLKREDRIRELLGL